MRPVPARLEEARARAAAREPERLTREILDGMRAALLEVYAAHAPLLDKLPLSGDVAANDLARLEVALDRLARYVEVAGGYRPEGALVEDHARLLDSLETQGRALAAALDGARDEALDAAETARARVALAAREAPEAAGVHAATEPVYDRLTGRSRYDAEEDPDLSFRLRCPREGCAHPDDYALSPGRSSHRLRCTSCMTGFTAYVAPVRSSARSAGSGAVSHEIVTRDYDGTERRLTFEEVAKGVPFQAQRRDLLVVLYDEDNRLCLVRNYTRGDEVWVAPKSRCFVATAALGPFAPEVLVLRRFRDAVLLRSRMGRAFVEVYERVGPGAAAWIARSPRRRRWAAGLTRLAARATRGSGRRGGAGG